MIKSRDDVVLYQFIPSLISLECYTQSIFAPHFVLIGKLLTYFPCSLSSCMTVVMEGNLNSMSHCHFRKVELLVVVTELLAFPVPSLVRM